MLRAAAALRGSRAMLRAGDPARAAAAARAQEAGPGARGAGPRHARRTRRSRSSSSRILHAARSRWRSITCGPVARTRPSRPCASALRENPDNVDAMRFLAQAYWGDEKQLVRRRSAAAPGDGRWRRATRPAWMLLGALLHEIGPSRGGDRLLPAATRTRARQCRRLVGAGHGYAHDRRHGEERRRLSSARSRCSPDVPGIHMSHAHVLKTLGDQQAALRDYRAAIALKPDFGEVYWSMANLKVFRFEDAEVAAMEEQLKREDLSESADVHFRFALGKAYEDMGDYDRAWEYYHTGNQRQRPAGIPRSRGHSRRATRRSRRSSAREFLERACRAGLRVRRPDLHRRPAALGLDADRADPREPQPGRRHAELPTLGEIAISIGRYRPRPQEYPESVRDLRGKDFRAYGRQYIEETRAYRSTGKPRFTDKLPNNFSHVGFAAPDPAEREDHQCAAASARQLPRQLQAALRQGAALHLRHERARAVLPPVPRDHAALAPRAAGQGARRALRGNGRPTSRRRCAASSRTAACRSRKPACASTRTPRRCGPRAPSRSGSRSTRVALGYLAALRKAPRPVAGGTRRHHRRSCPERPQRGALNPPGAQSYGQTSRPWMALRTSIVRFTDSSALVRREVVDRDRGRRRAACDDGVREHAEPAREALARDACSDRGRDAAAVRSA